MNHREHREHREFFSPLCSLWLIIILFYSPKLCFADDPPKSSSNPQSAIRNPQSSEIDPAAFGKPAVRVYADKDGLPANTVAAIALDHKGYLWVGTLNGAAYYNGRKWIPVDIPNGAASNIVSDILTSMDGGIWFATRGGGISRLKNGQWTVYDKSSGLPNNIVYELMETTSSGGNQVVWAATSSGAARLEEGRWTIFDVSSGLPDNEVFCLLETSSAGGGRVLWAGTNGGLARLEDGKSTVYDTKSGLPDNRVQSLLETTDESGSRILWAGTNNGLARLESGKWSVYNTKSGLPNNTVSTHGLLESISPNGGRALWVGTLGGGLARLENGVWTVYDTKSGLPNNQVYSLFETVLPDGRRTLWAGINSGGLVRLEQGKWVGFDKTNGLPGNTVTSIKESLSPKGGRAYWIGTHNGLARLENGVWAVYNTKSGLPSNIVYDLLESVSPNGSRAMWVGTAGGLARLENGRRTVYDVKSGLPNNYVMALLETKSESGERVLWAGTYGGLAKFENGKWTVYNAASGLPDNQVTSLIETVSKDGSRALWAGTTGGLAKLEDGKWTLYDTASGLPNNFIVSMNKTVAPDGSNLLWVGTTGGAARMNLDSKSAKWSVIAAPALPDDIIYDVLEDSRRRIYLFTNKGVARLTPRSTGGPADRPYDLSDYDIRVFTTEDGLPSNEFEQGKYLVDDLGRIWAGTVAGAAMLDPSKEYEDRSPKPLYIERALLGGMPKAIKNESLTYKENNLTFEFALLSYFRESETRYRSQLVGFDEQPTEWTANAERIYTNLSEGEYVFKVWGRDYAGNITGPEEIAFKIRPAPWRSWWAYLFYFSGLTAVGYGSRRFRLQALERRNLMLEEKVKERTSELVKRNEELVESHKRADRIFSALAEALPGTILDEKYRLDKKIGSGGFGAVYRGSHLILKRPIAVKVFKPAPGNDSAEALERFRQEAVSACRINHPNAVAVLDSGISSEGIAYLVMELLQGHSLAQELKVRGSVSLGRAALILIPVCDLLSKAHSTGIIHRDVKPENIFLHRGEEGEIVKVVDFGIAKLVGEEWGSAAQNLTGTGAIIGTPVYMAPERLANKPYDGKADVYSVGVLLYEMLCGQLPFYSDEGPWQTALMHLTMEPVSPKKINPDIPEQTERVMLSALEKDPQKRPDAMELKRKFLKALDLDPELAADDFKAAVYERFGMKDEAIELAVEDEQAGRTALKTDGMTDDRWRQIEEIFYAALERDDEDRDAFLDEACAGDRALREKVEALIAADDMVEGKSFLKSPVAGPDEDAE